MRVICTAVVLAFRFVPSEALPPPSFLGAVDCSSWRPIVPRGSITTAAAEHHISVARS